MEEDVRAEIEDGLRLVISKATARRPGDIRLTDDLVHDLGMAGDDLQEVLVEYSRRFNVNIESMHIPFDGALDEGGVSILGMLKFFGVLLGIVDRGPPVVTVGELVEAAVRVRM
jgi:hypothetical protein